MIIRILSWLTSVPLIVPLSKFFIKGFGAIVKQEEVLKRIKYEKRLFQRYSNHFGKLEVLNGPFKGLKYPRFDSSGSRVFPKLLGSYEKEIQPIIEKLCKINFDQILDVGCAEGYYAVGMAKKLKESKILAFDTNPIARQQCCEMVELNNVESNVEIESECSPKFLSKFHFSNRSLVICDCEGYENMLFNIDNIDNLKSTHLLIEIHEFIVPGVSNYLFDLFERTHNLELVASVDDILKVRNYGYKELEDMNEQDKLWILQEKRLNYMEWAYFSPKVESADNS